jgi:hypothetical protein
LREPKQPHVGIALNQHFGGEDAIIHKNACALRRVEAARLALPRWPIGSLAEYQESAGIGRQAQGRGGMALSDDYKIYVDASQPATLNDGAGALTDCATLQEAVLAWHRLPPGQKIRATVKVIGGPVYTAHEMDRLHYGPKPA